MCEKYMEWTDFDLGLRLEKKAAMLQGKFSLVGSFYATVIFLAR
jgi:hypothetical protein